MLAIFRACRSRRVRASPCALSQSGRIQEGAMSDRLKGKRIMITGAVDNIGKEAVRAFVAEGARVVVGDINEQDGRVVAAEFGPAVHFLKVDVTDEGAIRSFVEAGVAWLGGLDV